MTCLIESSIVGSVDIINIKREKIKRILEHTPKLTYMLSQVREERDGSIFFNPDIQRIDRILLKLGKGHAAFELNEPQFVMPSNMAFTPLHLITPEIRNSFETPPMPLLWPEVGSRAMQRLVTTELGKRRAVWVIAQSGKYRYLTSVDDNILVRVVISEYLACEVIWATD